MILVLASWPPMKSSNFGTELIIELMVSKKSMSSTSSKGWYPKTTNNVMCPHTFLSYWSSHGKLSFTPINLPTNGESWGVVIGEFDPASLHTSTAAGGSMIATPPGILPLDPITLPYWLCRNNMWPRTRLLPVLTTHVSWIQYTMIFLAITRSTIGSTKGSNILYSPVKPCTFCV